MVDLRPTNKQADSFTLDRSKQGPPVMKRREKIRVALFLVGTFCFIGLMVDAWLDDTPDPTELTEVSREDPDPDLEPMEMIDLGGLPDLPSYERIKQQAGKIDAMMRDEQLVRYHLRPLDDLSFAWARAQLERDRDQPPLPQAYTAEDLVFERVQHGRPVIASGTLVERREMSVPGLDDERWYQLSVLLDNADDVAVFLHVIAPRWAAPQDEDDQGLVPGLPIRVVGRYMGAAELPVAGGDSQEVPVVAAYALANQDETSVTSLLSLGDLSDDQRDRTWKPDPDIFDRVVDYPGNPRQSVLERRPYYYLLGQVKLDRSTPDVYADAQPIETMADAIYNDPAAHRGEVFTVRGRVWEAWFDEQVARDQPYGVDRVMRIWMWRKVYGIGDNPFWDLYELAVIAPGDDPLPMRGQMIEATGRLLKVQMYHTPMSQFHFLVDQDQEQSENVLFKFLVTPEIELIPEPPERSFFGWNLAFLIISASFFLCMGWLIIRDHLHEDDYKQGVRKLRKGRRAKRTGGAPSVDAPADAEGEPSRPDADDGDGR